jgi:hypothetical protein
MLTVIDTKYITLNTQHCIKRPTNGLYQSSFLSLIDFPFKDVLKDDDDILYSHVSIISAQIPVSFYLVNYTTNVLKYSVNNGAILSMTLERGNYNLNTLIDALKAGFLTAGFAFSITINKITGRLLFTSPVLTTFKIYNSTFGSTINEIIGFDSVNSYSSTGNVLLGEHPCSLVGIKVLKVSSSALRTNSLASGSLGNLIATIPVNSPPYGLILYENKSNNNGGLLLNREISNIDIQITDENNAPINFNNVEYSLCLGITTTRILKDKLNSSSFRDSTRQIMNIPQEQPTITPDVFNDENDLDFYMYQHGIQM